MVVVVRMELVVVLRRGVSGGDSEERVSGSIEEMG